MQQYNLEKLIKIDIVIRKVFFIKFKPYVKLVFEEGIVLKEIFDTKKEALIYCEKIKQSGKWLIQK